MFGMKIQTVDFFSEDAPAKFVQSLKETGFAVVTNHIVTPTVLNEVYADWKEFFKSDSKGDYIHAPQSQVGYFPFRSENAKGYSVKDLKEFFHLYKKEDLPATLQSTATLIVREQLLLTASHLLNWIDQNTPKEVFQGKESLVSMISRSRQTLLRILHYPPLTGDHEAGAVRATAHEDINLITLLPAATQPGLEVQDINGTWHKIECNPGDIIVNAGDMLQLTTSGYFKSTTHRVVNPDGPEAQESRYSLPLFLHPRPEVYLADGRTADAYLNERLAEIGIK